MFGIKHPNTFIKDYKLLELNHTHFTWGEIKLLYALRLFLERGKSGVFGRQLYLQLLQEHSPQEILKSINIDLDQEFKELQNQWIYKT